MKTRVFKDDRFESKLKKYGFVKIPFWDTKLVSSIYEKFEKEFDESHLPDKKFHTTYETKNTQLIDKVRLFLEPHFLEKTNNLFINMLPISASFLVKEPGVESESPLHQDASFVDEPNECSVSVWVALQDCNAKNSCLQFIPKSHNLFTGVRSIPFNNDYIEKHKKHLAPYITKNTIKAGEAFVFYNATLHASGNNLSPIKRLAAVMGFYSSNAQLSLYLKDTLEEKINRYKISVEQLKQINDVFAPDSNQLINTFDFPKSLQKRDVDAFLKKEFSYYERIIRNYSRYLNFINLHN